MSIIPFGIIGAVLGGAVGAAAGSQIGKGDGRTLATVGGAIIGALVGGNIGRGVLDLDPPERGETIVLELSSYQIELARFQVSFR